MGAYDTRLIKLSLTIAFTFIFLQLLISYKSIIQSPSPIHFVPNMPEKAGSVDSGIIIRPSLSPKCDGDFDFVVGGNYSFEVTEATYDSTPLTKERFRRHHPEIPVFHNIMVQFSLNDALEPEVGSTQRGVNITNMSNITAFIYPSQDNVHIEVDHLRKVRCARPIHEQYTKNRICVWSMSLSLLPISRSSDLGFNKLLDQIQTNEKAEILLDIPLLVKETKEKLETIRPKIGFSCVDAFNIQQEVEWLTKPGTRKCTDSKQVLMVLGSPISGPASMEGGAIAAAHFAFRALTAKVQFSSVSLAFTTPMTRSRMAHECDNVKDCVQAHVANNARVMQHYKEIMESEFDKLGLSHVLRRRIVVTEFCRLGGKGPGDGCRRLRASGQVAWGEFTIAQMAYEHKWIGSMDLDEFIGSDPAIPGQHFRPSVDAVDFFDKLNDNSGRPDSIQLLWFRSVLESISHTSLSSVISDSNRLNITVKDRNGVIKHEPSFETCYTQDNGKSFAKCTNVVGTGVHTSTIVSNPDNITSYNQAKVMRTHNSSVRIWEARKERKFKKLGFCTLTTR